MSRRLPVLLFVAIAAVECALVFVTTVAGAFFVWDDYAHLDAVRALPMASFLGATILGLFRPLTLAAMKAQFICFGWAPSGYVAVTALLNLGNAVLFAFVLRSFGENEVVRWLAAAFFLVFPPANETHVWFGSQFDLLCVTGVLVSLLFWAAAVRVGIAARRVLLLAVLAAGSLLLALLAKEVALAAPLLLIALALGRPGRPATAPFRRVLASATLSAIPAGAFVALRMGAMPLNESHYGAPFQLFREAPLLLNLRRYAVAMFSYPYFGASQGAAVFAHGAGLLALVGVLLGLRAAGVRAGAASCAASVGFLAPVLWTWIAPDAAVGGRLVYAAALPIAFLFGVGADSAAAAIREAGGARDRSTLSLAGALLLASFFAGACLSGLSLQRYWNDAFALARSAVGQAERLQARANVFVRNLPREFRGGPYVLKCYAFPIYIAGRRGRAPEFRCDSVAVERRGNDVVEAGPREPDVYSGYVKPRSDELSVELDLQFRKRPASAEVVAPRPSK
jgi:hypothetical protein